MLGPLSSRNISLGRKEDAVGLLSEKRRIIVVKIAMNNFSSSTTLR
jgi:hypothetical protein